MNCERAWFYKYNGIRRCIHEYLIGKKHVFVDCIVILNSLHAAFWSFFSSIFTLYALLQTSNKTNQTPLVWSNHSIRSLHYWYFCCCMKFILLVVTMLHTGVSVVYIISWHCCCYSIFLTSFSVYYTLFEFRLMNVWVSSLIINTGYAYWQHTTLPKVTTNRTVIVDVIRIRTITYSICICVLYAKDFIQQRMMTT